MVVIATTNRSELTDDALLRSRRLDQHVEVADPDTPAWRETFAIHTHDRPLTDDESTIEDIELTMAHFEAVLDGVDAGGGGRETGSDPRSRLKWSSYGGPPPCPLPPPLPPEPPLP